jgi:hypothetical protein
VNTGIPERKIRLKRRSGIAPSDPPRYRIQLFSPKGAYPKGTHCNPTALFHADGDMAFAVTYGTGWQEVDHLPYSEVDWLEPEVVRLLGSMMLAEDTENGLRRRFYAVPHAGFEVDETDLDLGDPSTAELIKAALIDTMDTPGWPKYFQDTWEACVGHSFNLDATSASAKRLQQRYHAAFSIDNHVLMRGVQALVKSDMLSGHYEFQEEAAIATFIALDASFELVTRHLRASGIKNPGSQQAGEWLYRTFEAPFGRSGGESSKYFEEFYDQRIQTMHPGSRFGDAPYAPVMVDDRIHLRIMLPQIFGYLLIGEHAPHFLQRVERT